VMALRADLTGLVDSAAIDAVRGHRDIESRRWRDGKIPSPCASELKRWAAGD